MKFFLFILFIPFVLSSCFTFQSISKREVLTVEKIRAEIKPNKIHWVKLNTGKELKLYVTRIDSVYIYGEVHEKDSYGFLVKYPYEDKLEALAKNASKVSVRKFNPRLTTTITVVPIILIVIVTNSGFVGYDY